MTSLKLTDSWDIDTDDTGSLMLVDGDNALAQDVATACRLFKGEYIYDTDYGIPYFQDVLGTGDTVILKHYLEEQAKTIEGVETAIASPVLTGRKITGSILLNNTEEVSL